MALEPKKAPGLDSFRALAFDIFGTLINEPEGLSAALKPLTLQLPDDHAAKTSAVAQDAAFGKHSAAIEQKDPSIAFEDMLAASYNALAEEWNVIADEKDAKALGQAATKYPAFPDTVEAMKTLGNYYQLIALSNVSEKGIAAVIEGPLKGVHFDAVLTAETIGSYKPDLRNFEYLLNKARQLGVEKDQLLMVAQGVASDHVPAKQMGINSAWISRNRPATERGYDGIGEANEGKVAFGWRWRSLGDMAQDVQAAVRAK